MKTKEHAFDRGYTAKAIEAAWENAKNQGNAIVCNFHKFGHTWKKLSPRLLDQLMERYGMADKEAKEAKE